MYVNEWLLLKGPGTFLGLPLNWIILTVCLIQPRINCEESFNGKLSRSGCPVGIVLLLDVGRPTSLWVVLLHGLGPTLYLK